MLRILTVVLVLFVVAGCTSTPVDLTQAPTTARYCDRYFIYRMCAQDIVGDGKVDVMYFEDSKEVFMYRPEIDEVVKSQLAMHECAQVMNDGLMAVSNRLLHINDDTGFFQKADIKSELIAHYMRYAPKISKCNNQDTKSTLADAEEGGDEFMDEFGEYAFEDYE